MNGLITEQTYATTLDLPINLPSTQLKQGDWLTVASVVISAPMQLVYTALTLQMTGTTINSVLDVAQSNKINPSLDLAFLGVFLNFDDTTHPANQTALDVLIIRDAQMLALDCVPVTATQGQLISTRTAAPLTFETPGVYSWVIANNMKPSTDANPAIPVSTSIDFNLCATGTVRLQLAPL